MSVRTKLEGLTPASTKNINLNMFFINNMIESLSIAFTRGVSCNRNTQTGFRNIGNSYQYESLKKQPLADVLKNFAIFTEKHLCWNLFLIKLQARNPENPTRIFSSEYCELF